MPQQAKPYQVVCFHNTTDLPPLLMGHYGQVNERGDHIQVWNGIITFPVWRAKLSWFTVLGPEEQARYEYLLQHWKGSRFDAFRNDKARFYAAARDFTATFGFNNITPMNHENFWLSRTTEDIKRQILIADEVSEADLAAAWSRFKDATFIMAKRFYELLEQ